MVVGAASHSGGHTLGVPRLESCRMRSCLLVMTATACFTLSTREASTPSFVGPGQPLSPRSEALRGMKGFRTARYSSGSRADAVMTAAVAGCAVYLASLVTKVARRQLWVAPLGAISLLFATEATAAAKKRQALVVDEIVQKAVKVSIGLTGAVGLAVFLTKFAGANIVVRSVAIAAGSLWMSLAPQAAYFPTAAAFCAIAVDQVILGAPWAKTSYQFVLFPVLLGTLQMLLLTRILAAAFGSAFRAVGLW